MRFYGVVCVMKGPDGVLWVICMPMVRAHPSQGEGMRTSTGDVKLVQLGKTVRRAGAAHMCDERCVPHRREQRVKHIADVCDGGMYEIWARQDGYPPHLG